MSESKHTPGSEWTLDGLVFSNGSTMVEESVRDFPVYAAAPKLLEAYTAACTAADAILAPMTAEFGRIMEEAPNQLITLTLCSVEVSIPAKKFMELYRATDRSALYLATGKDQ